MCSINMNSAMRTCVITGANAGIGKSAAHQLADKDWRVIMVCRNLAKAQNVCDIIKNETGNEQVFVMQADMSLTADAFAYDATSPCCLRGCGLCC